MLLEIAQQQINECKLSHDDLTDCYHLIKDKVNSFEYAIPAGYELKSLSVSDVKTINNLWLHRFAGSESYLENLIRNNISLGLFNVADNAIAGWILWFVVLQIVSQQK
jgi:hypothetical protein